MERLLNFVYTYRAFFTFLLLELFCIWLVVKNNQYQSAAYFNTSNAFFARIHTTSQNIRDYFALTSINALLAQENNQLRKKVERQNQALHFSPTKANTDSALINQYDFISARVINNSTKYYKNFITIDRGENSGIKPGMAVISANNVVGKVKSVSPHYAVLISILNLDEQVSCLIKRTGHFGTVQWDGTNPQLTNLKYIPRHVKPVVGDSIVTSEYNAIFPRGIFVGKIKEIELKEESLFYDIKVELGLDFSKLSFVEVIKNNLKKERDSLETKTIGEPK
ncbi:MAG: Rod shape-determining protein MreC [Cytophagales bacterium]|jgi:rod shape-determining protein MreC|nr:rod shape-determining protein MreC [Bacteroidota bacterium]MBS1979687.1 rod shape-determining protein MreC [Bacteroidota bacterium]WHZ06940.1 MAG: Rod shape-determining protein MreC [Cytophagales bacterium]